MTNVLMVTFLVSTERRHTGVYSSGDRKRSVSVRGNR